MSLLLESSSDLVEGISLDNWVKSLYCIGSKSECHLTPFSMYTTGKNVMDVISNSDLVFRVLYLPRVDLYTYVADHLASDQQRGEVKDCYRRIHRQLW